MNRMLRLNRALWDERARIHGRGSDWYPVRKLISGTGGWAKPIPDDLGSINGRSMLHLQCHIGLDSLHWAAKGARVTGADFSPVAITEARRLSRESGIKADFVEADLHRLPKVLTGRFDIVVTTYGAICWLPDLRRWARIIANYLKPNGFFYMAEIHPIMFALNWDGPGETPRFADSYFPAGAVRLVAGRGTYADRHAPTKHRVHFGWQHHLGEVVESLREAGLAIEYLREWPFAYCDMLYYTRRKAMRQDRKGWWHLTKDGGKLPMMFSLRATRARRR